MTTNINESVSVDLLSNHVTKRAYPWVMHWRGRKYILRQVGMHHHIYEGKVLLHVFSVTDGISSFRLKFDTESLHWQLLEVDSN